MRMIMLTLLAALPVTSPAQAAPLDRAECTEMAGKMRAAMTALESGRESIVASAGGGRDTPQINNR
jgi:hypothetical protein